MLIRFFIAWNPMMVRDPVDGDFIVSCQQPVADLDSGDGESCPGPMLSVLVLSMAMVESPKTVYLWPLCSRRPILSTCYMAYTSASKTSLLVPR